MIKFSIIIPVYNVEKYIEKCLESIANQTYKNYEVIIVCDKCDDNSEKIVDNYVNEYKWMKLYYEKTGLSKARNIGVEKVTGDYIVFLDSDDYLEMDFLETLSKNLIDNVDLLRFQAREIRNDNSTDYTEIAFSYVNGKDAFVYISKFNYVENAWLYCYKTDFWKNNNFKFADNCVAEDFGLIPTIISKAETMRCISYIGYNYVQRENSLMSNKNYSKRIKKMNDMLLQANTEKRHLYKEDNTDLIISYINMALIDYCTTLKYTDYIKYKKLLKKERCFDYIRTNTFKNKIKKFFIKNLTWITMNMHRRIHG